ncbi:MULTISPECIES: AAA family ATPase [unclassified Streptococcus]|uniref:AAA family ATPase n=1 Tax=unclassified Streptococcus TaxID=2608887 RepID=UPI0020C89221|nr:MULTISPECIES: AAA family ATPase [unclassified Streptococcus]MCP9060124.1 AAA family ATPase [Streptococcus sp. CF7_Ac1-12]MCP9084711.1 AAA family ATPase [Streptococcus sp. CF7_Ac1-8]
MYSSIKELIENIESEKKRLQDIFSQLADYEKEAYENQYQQVDNDFSSLIDLINNELDDEFLSGDVTEKYKKLRENWLRNIFSCHGSDVYTYETNLPQILKDFKAIKLFSFIAKIDSTTVIIGANGAGKTSLINELRKNSIDEMYVLPAQKLLYFVSNTHNRNGITKEKYIQDLKEVNIKYDTIEIQTHQIEDDFSGTFTKLITLWVKDFAKVMTDNARVVGEVSIALLDRVEQIWNQIFPEITFYPESDDRVLEVVRNGDKYSINGLSDGERCVLFYIGNVLLAPENSYIVVDEPETFLNAAVYNELWDLLISERHDCQFIFASHNMDFVQSRTNATYIWCKKFEAPYNLEYQKLDDSLNLPLKLLTEVSGTKKPILFCEGTKNSIDYQIYSKLFSDFCFVKPVQGHKQVIQHTKAYNNLQLLHGNTAYGIIDNDWMDKSSIQVYKEQGIFVLPFNEVEMILVDEEVVKSCLHFDDDKEKQQKIKNLQQSIIESCKEKKDKIISIALKKRLDEFLEGSCIQNNKPSKEDVEEFFKSLVDEFDVSSTVDNITSIVEASLASSDFSRILKICNLKKEIIDYRGNTEVVPNFKDKALRRIALDSDLQKKLRQKYFEELEMKLLKQ